MSLDRLQRVFLLTGLAVGLAASSAAYAQDAAKKELAARTQPPESQPGREPRFRRIAPGVERTIDPQTQQEERFSRHDLKDLLKQNPTFGERDSSLNLATNVKFSHDVWALEFTFKPLRFVEVDMPHPDGRFERKTIWYLYYHVTNRSGQKVQFVPRFLLHSWDTNKWYPDRLAPLAVPLIQKREDPARELLNTVEMAEYDLAAAKGDAVQAVWGVATWEDVDPRTDRFSIYVQGLTNAYQWNDVEEGKPRFFRKTLELNFWRPSDDVSDDESEIRFGMPEEGMTACHLRHVREVAELTAVAAAESQRRTDAVNNDTEPRPLSAQDREKIAQDVLNELSVRTGVPSEQLLTWEKAAAPIPASQVEPLREALAAELKMVEVDYRWLYK